MLPFQACFDLETYLEFVLVKVFLKKIKYQAIYEASKKSKGLFCFEFDDKKQKKKSRLRREKNVSVMNWRKKKYQLLTTFCLLSFNTFL